MFFGNIKKRFFVSYIVDYQNVKVLNEAVSRHSKL